MEQLFYLLNGRFLYDMSLSVRDLSVPASVLILSVFARTNHYWVVFDKKEGKK